MHFESNVILHKSSNMKNYTVHLRDAKFFASLCHESPPFCGQIGFCYQKKLTQAVYVRQRHHLHGFQLAWSYENATVNKLLSCIFIKFYTANTVSKKESLFFVRILCNQNLSISFPPFQLFSLSNLSNRSLHLVEKAKENRTIDTPPDRVLLNNFEINANKA